MKAQITQKLAEGLNPDFLEVIDESHLHEGHGGWREGGNTHFRVKIRATMLKGKTRVAQHRAVNGLLSDEFAAGVHALAIEIL